MRLAFVPCGGVPPVASCIMLMVLGASHHDLELTQLDRLAGRSRRCSAERSASWPRDRTSPIVGAVVVSTCNRLEIYLDAVRFHDAIDEVTARSRR